MRRLFDQVGLAWASRTRGPCCSLCIQPHSSSLRSRIYCAILRDMRVRVLLEPAAATQRRTYSRFQRLYVVFSHRCVNHLFCSQFRTACTASLCLVCPSSVSGCEYVLTSLLWSLTHRHSYAPVSYGVTYAVAHEVRPRILHVRVYHPHHKTSP